MIFKINHGFAWSWLLQRRLPLPHTLLLLIKLSDSQSAHPLRQRGLGDGIQILTHFLTLLIHWGKVVYTSASITLEGGFK